MQCGQKLGPNGPRKLKAFFRLSSLHRPLLVEHVRCGRWRQEISHPAKTEFPEDGYFFLLRLIIILTADLSGAKRTAPMSVLNSSITSGSGEFLDPEEI
jgi:hypothetical protein